MNKPAITVGVVEFLAVASYVIIFTVLWRGLTAQAGDTTLGRTMAAVYS